MLYHTEEHTEAAPVVVVGHLSHDLAVDLVLQSLVLRGWTEDLVRQLHGAAGMFDGVVAHVLQDRCRHMLRIHTDDEETKLN